MASRTRQIMNTDYAIATTGNGQGDDNAEMDCFIVWLRPKVIVEKYNFGQPHKVIDSAVIKSLELLKREIKIVP
jgi:nicotinamide-nucleotide amidase